MFFLSCADGPGLIQLYACMSMYICVCIYTYIYVIFHNVYIWRIYLCMDRSMQANANTYICIYIYMYVCVCICIKMLRTYTVCIYVYVHVYMYISGYEYIHTWQTLKPRIDDRILGSLHSCSRTAFADIERPEWLRSQFLYLASL